MTSINSRALSLPTMSVPLTRRYWLLLSAIFGAPWVGLYMSLPLYLVLLGTAATTGTRAMVAVPVTTAACLAHWTIMALGIRVFGEDDLIVFWFLSGAATYALLRPLMVHTTATATATAVAADRIGPASHA
ncbi:hypothetical protein [Chthonobacter rhizosphaerae]|uniref:hypothetical protein n=1 Tax=Chthonobacter rhizosphaerae TaxID=2735553 RepID=UPI0015EF41F6|nr:hypothetical protein [Chthonobacter rhizosphaerae]